MASALWQPAPLPTMNILVACEKYGRVRDAFIARGHNAVSCDLLASESLAGPHIIGDARELLKEPWDLVIAHPPCTYLCHSGVRHLHTDPDRWAKMEAAAEFFLACLHANAAKVAVENPTMHRYAREAVGIDREDFAVQPWWFGEPYSKRTCFWTRGTLPPLMPTKMGNQADLLARWREESNLAHRERTDARSITPQGLADAMALQWG